MNVFEVVSKPELNEFRIRGDDSQDYISDERLKELGFDKSKGAAIFRPYGNDSTPWIANSQNIKSLMKEAFAIYVEEALTDKTNKDEYETFFTNWLMGSGKVDRDNFKRVLQHASNNSEPQITHSEALGMALNFYVLANKRVETELPD